MGRQLAPGECFVSIECLDDNAGTLESCTRGTLVGFIVGSSSSLSGNKSAIRQAFLLEKRRLGYGSEASLGTTSIETSP